MVRAARTAGLLRDARTGRLSAVNTSTFLTGGEAEDEVTRVASSAAAPQTMTTGLLLLAAALQAVAVAYGLVLRSRRRAAGAWSFLLGAMLSMLAWRVVVLLDVDPPWFFNPAIAIWARRAW